MNASNLTECMGGACAKKSQWRNIKNGRRDECTYRVGWWNRVALLYISFAKKRKRNVFAGTRLKSVSNVSRLKKSPRERISLHLSLGSTKYLITKDLRFKFHAFEKVLI
jgi:hypothetical protein